MYSIRIIISYWHNLKTSRSKHYCGQVYRQISVLTENRHLGPWIRSALKNEIKGSFEEKEEVLKKGDETETEMKWRQNRLEPELNFVF